MTSLFYPMVPQRGKRRFSRKRVLGVGVYHHPREAVRGVFGPASEVESVAFERGWIDLERVDVDYSNVLCEL